MAIFIFSWSVIKYESYMTRPFKVLGIQQIAIGNESKSTVGKFLG